MMNTKICTKCKIEKELFEYGIDNQKSNSLSSWCKKCSRNRSKKNMDKYRQENKNNNNNIYTKFCSTCKKEKNIDEFNKDITRKGGYTYECKECLSFRRKNNKEQIFVSVKKYKEKNKEKVVQGQKKYQMSLIGRYKKYERRAKEQNMIFEVSLGLFGSLTEQLCYYCGSYSKSKNYCGLDRIDSNKRIYN